MEKLDQVLDLLEKAMPLLEKFNKWQELEAEREKIAAEAEAESQREFEKWVEEKRKTEAEQEKNTEEISQHFFGGKKWEQERLVPKNF